jgi:hypothetical protein
MIHWAMPSLTRLLSESLIEKSNVADCDSSFKYDLGANPTPCYNGATGEILFKAPSPGARRISRLRLRKVFAEDLDVKWGKQLVSITHKEGADGPTTLEFADGETLDADYVIGTDGASSKVREILLGPEVAASKLSGVTIAIGCPTYGDAEKAKFARSAHPIGAMVFHSAGVGGTGSMSHSIPPP